MTTLENLTLHLSWEDLTTVQRINLEELVIKKKLQFFLLICILEYKSYYTVLYVVLELTLAALRWENNLS